MVHVLNAGSAFARGETRLPAAAFSTRSRPGAYQYSLLKKPTPSPSSGRRMYGEGPMRCCCCSLPVTLADFSIVFACFGGDTATTVVVNSCGAVLCCVVQSGVVLTDYVAVVSWWIFRGFFVDIWGIASCWRLVFVALSPRPLPKHATIGV